MWQVCALWNTRTFLNSAPFGQKSIEMKIGQLSHLLFSTTRFCTIVLRLFHILFLLHFEIPLLLFTFLFFLREVSSSFSSTCLLYLVLAKLSRRIGARSKKSKKSTDINFSLKMAISWLVPLAYSLTLQLLVSNCLVTLSWFSCKCRTIKLKKANITVQ